MNVQAVEKYIILMRYGGYPKREFTDRQSLRATCVPVGADVSSFRKIILRENHMMSFLTCMKNLSRQTLLALEKKTLSKMTN